MTPETVLHGAATRGWGPARQTLRALLGRQTTLELSPAALDALVGRIEFACWRPGQEVIGRDDTAAIRIVVGGVVKVVCQGVGGRDVTVHMVGPGGFLHLVSPRSDTVRRVSAVAHTPALVGRMSNAAWCDVLGQLRAEDSLRLAACAWQTLSRRLYDKCALLAQPIRVRVLHELRTLAHDFGSPHPAGLCVDLPLSHADLASLVGAARANVTRAVGSLRADGVLASTAGRFVLTAAA